MNNFENLLQPINKAKEENMETIKKIALVLVIVGALNWALVGLFDLDLVATIFGSSENMLARIIYIVIGICGLICIPILFDDLEKK